MTANDPTHFLLLRTISRSDSISIQSIQYSIESLKDEIKLLKVNDDDDTSQQLSNSMTSDVLQIGIGSNKTDSGFDLRSADFTVQ